MDEDICKNRLPEIEADTGCFEDIANRPVTSGDRPLCRYVIVQERGYCHRFPNEEMKYLNMLTSGRSRLSFGNMILWKKSINGQRRSFSQLRRLRHVKIYGRIRIVLLGIDKGSLKQAVRYAKQNLNTFVEERRAYASAESLAELRESITIISDLRGVQNRKFSRILTSLPLAEQAYAMDYDKFETRYYVDQYITIISKFTYINVSTAAGRNLIADACDAVAEELLSAKSFRGGKYYRGLDIRNSRGRLFL